MDGACQSFDFVFVYLDDILVASASQTEHQEHLFRFFKRLPDFGLVVNDDKCQFGRSQIECSGHLISKRRARPLPSKVESIQCFSPPTTTKDLQRFVGMVNFYY